MTDRPPFESNDTLPTTLRFGAGLLLGVVIPALIIFMFDFGWMIVAALWPLLLIQMLFEIFARGLWYGLTRLFSRSRQSPEPMESIQPEGPTAFTRYYAVHVGGALGSAYCLWAAFKHGPLSGVFA